MAYSDTAQTSAVSGFGNITSVFDTLAARVAAYRLFRETFNSLSALSDHELADLGLNRSELYSIAKTAASRPTV